MQLIVNPIMDTLPAITPEHKELFNEVVSPMPGVLDKLLVSVGDVVEVGAPVAVIIAMKMEHILKAPCTGPVKSIAGQTGINVVKGAPIVTF